MVQKLTIDQAKANASMFMYIFAPDEFLNAIPRKYANIIRGKAANQTKILMLSAKDYGNTYEEYTDAVRAGFIEQYDMTPIDALIVLAQGGTVAGKNWKEGVFGVGALNKSFKGTDITVNPDNGYMLRDGKYLPVYDTIYADVNGKSVAYQLYYYDETTGKRYMSQYNKTLKKYYAQSYSDKDGTMYSASGKTLNGSDAGSIWETVLLCLQQFVDWIISIFGTNNNTEMISAENTLPNQKTDGFVYESGFSEAAMILLALVAGGAILSGGIKKSK